jgi:hypothetical protein
MFISLDFFVGSHAKHTHDYLCVQACTLEVIVTAVSHQRTDIVALPSSGEVNFNRWEWTESLTIRRTIV